MINVETPERRSVKKKPNWKLILAFCLASLPILTGCQTSNNNLIKPTETFAAQTITSTTKLPELTPTPTTTRTATTTPTRLPPTATPTPAPSTILEAFAAPFVQNQTQQDNLANQKYPEQQDCVDEKINTDLLNVFVALRFEDRQPPDFTDPGNYDTGFAVLSINRRNGTTGLYNFSADFHDPRIALNYFHQPKLISPDTRLSKTMELYGFDGVRPFLECATALRIRNSVLVDEKELANYIDFLKGIDFVSNQQTAILPYFWEGRLQSGFNIPANTSFRANGMQAIGIIKGVGDVNATSGYTSSNENGVRSAQVLDATLTATKNYVWENKIEGIKQINEYVRRRIAISKNTLEAKNRGFVTDFPLNQLTDGLDDFQTNWFKYLLNPKSFTTFPTQVNRVNVADDLASSFKGFPHGCSGMRVASRQDMLTPKETASDQTNLYLYEKSLNQCFREILK